MQYNNKTRDEIKTDVTDDFDKTQETGVWLEARNDYETYESWVRIAEKYQASMEKAFDKIAPELKGEMQAKREKLITELNQNKDNLSGRKLFVDAKPFIEKVSTMIDKVEDDALMLLEQAKQEKELHQKVGAESQGKSYIKLGKDGTMNLTKSVNKPRIDQVLGGVMKEWQAWLIDYTKCTNPRIQKKMKDIIGWSACYLVQWKDKQWNTTYTLQQKDGSTRKKINQRALIREGVSLRSPQVIQRMGKKKQEELLAQKIEKIKTDTLEVTKGLKMLKSWSWLHTALTNSPNTSTREEFFKTTDARLSELVIMAKKNGRELAVDSVSKLRGAPWAKMELHFITGTEENNINFLRKWKDKVSDECWNIIDNNETDYMNFVKQRLAQKWNDVSFLTQTEDIFADDAQSQKEGAEKTPEVMIESDRLVKVWYGLGIVRDIIQNVRQDKWDTRSSGDTELTGLLQYASNAIVAVEKWSVSESQLQKIVDKIYGWMLPFTRGRVPKSYVEDIISWNRKTKKEAHVATRRFGDSLSILWNAHTSFLKKYEMQEEWFEITENEDLNKLYQNINTKLDVTNEKNHGLLQSLYNVDNATGENSVESILRGADILPVVWVIATDKIKELCNTIKQKIEQTREMIDANIPTVETMWADMEMRSVEIMAKSSKTEEDIALLQQYHVMKDDANLRQELFSASASIAQEQMKLWAMQSVIQWPVATLFAKEAGGTSSDLFDDIVGAGGVFERSDENVVALGEWVKMIAEEIAFMVVVTALSATWVWLPAAAALSVAKIAKWWKNARRIRSFLKPSRHIGSFNDISYIKNLDKSWNIAKLLNNGATRFMANKADDIAMGTYRGLTHTLLATTYRGERDKDFNEHLVSVLQNVGMYSILWIVGKSAQSWRIAKLFDGGSKVFNPKHINAGKFIAEEMMMNPMDLAINYAFADQSMGAQDIATNMVLWLVFEWMWAIRMPWSTTKQKITDLVLHKNAIQINGKKVSHEDAFKIIEANKKEVQPKQLNSIEKNNNVRVVPLSSKQAPSPKKSIEKTLSPEQQKQIQTLEAEIKQLEVQRRTIRDMRKQPSSLLESANQAGLKKWTKLSKAGDASGKYQILSINDKGITVISAQKGKQTPITISDKATFESDGRRIVDTKKSEAFAGALTSQQKVPSLDRISNQKAALQKKITQTQAEIKKIETENKNPSMNGYFVDNIKKLHSTNMYRGWEKYRATVQQDGTIQLKLADGKEHVTYSSFGKMMADGVGVIHSQQNKRTRTQQQKHEQYKKLINDERAYMADRTTSLDAKRQELSDLQIQQKQLESDYNQAKKLDDKHKQIAKEAEAIAQKINKKNAEIANIQSSLSHSLVSGKVESIPSVVDKRQSSYVEDFLWADALLRSQNIDDLSPAMRDFINLADDADPVLIRQKVEALQREIGLTWKDVDGILWPKTHGALRNHLASPEKKRVSFEKQLDDAAKGIVDNIFAQKNPKNTSEAMSMVEEFGIWLGKTAVWPTMKFVSDAMDRLKSIKIKFPDLNMKQEIDDIKKSLIKIRTEKRLSVIVQYADKTFDEKAVFWNKMKNKNLSEKELRAVYEMFAGKTDFNDRVRVGDRKTQLKWKIESEISHVDMITFSNLHMPEWVSNIEFIRKIWRLLEGEVTTMRGKNKTIRSYRVKERSANGDLLVESIFTTPSGTMRGDVSSVEVKIPKRIVDQVAEASGDPKEFVRQQRKIQKLQKQQKQIKSMRERNFNNEGGSPKKAKKLDKQGRNMQKKIDKIVGRDIKHDFWKNPEMTLSNKSVELPLMSDGDMYEVHIGSKKLTVEKHEWVYVLLGEGENHGSVRKKLKEGIDYVMWRKTDLGQEFGLGWDNRTSREHFSIRVDDGVVRIKDLDSTNKTTIRLNKDEWDIQIPQNIKQKEVKNNASKVASGVDGIVVNRDMISGFDEHVLSPKTRSFYETYWPPKHTIKMGEHTMYVTDRIQVTEVYVSIEGETRTRSPREYIVWYTKDWQSRLFYRSSSEAERRSTPWLRTDGNFSKFEVGNSSYETTTKIHALIGEEFDAYVIGQKHNPIYREYENSSWERINKLSEWVPNPIDFSAWKWHKDVLYNGQAMNKEVSIDLMFPSHKNAVNFYRGRSLEAVKGDYSELKIQWLDLQSMKIEKDKSYGFNHDHLWEIGVDVVKMKRGWRDVDVHFAHAKNDNPDQVFITNVVYADAKINSFWMYDRQINAWPLVAKPIDYAVSQAWQVPVDANYKMYGGTYMDIRDLYQENPLIKSYKQHMLAWVHENWL